MRGGIHLAALLALALGGCAAAKDSLSDSNLGYAPDSAAASADWSRAEAVNVTLADFEFQPSRLSFQSGQAYRLHIENKGGGTHFFAAEGFFKAITAAKLVEPGGSLEHPHLKEIAVAPGQSKDLFFVAATKGTYGLKCTAAFHAGMGMAGEIDIL
jgi:uncharacterized cupredoxin-like copper-binding protein